MGTKTDAPVAIRLDTLLKRVGKPVACEGAGVGTSNQPVICPHCHEPLINIGMARISKAPIWAHASTVPAGDDYDLADVMDAQQVHCLGRQVEALKRNQYPTLLRVIGEIREALGVGGKPMLTELPDIVRQRCGPPSPIKDKNA